jgi:hypothetical protein
MKKSPGSLRALRPVKTDTRNDLRVKAKKLNIIPYYNLNKTQLRARILRRIRVYQNQPSIPSGLSP